MLRSVCLSLSTACLVLVTACLTDQSAVAQDIDDRLVSAPKLNAQGLEREWETHVEVDSSYGKIAYGTLHAHSTKSLTSYVITYGNQYEVIQETDLGPRGEPYGIVGAQEAATLRVEILAAEGIDAEVTEKVSPFLTLYILTDQFVVQAIDAETGASKWSTKVGRRGWPTAPIGVSDDYVCLTNGMRVYCLDAETGQPLWDRPLSSARGGGPMLTSEYVFVPKINGTLEIFSLTDPKEPTEQIIGLGRAMRTPQFTPRNNAVWVSDRNSLFLAPTDAEKYGIDYRLTFSRPISSNVAMADNERLVLSTDDSAVYCLSEPRGQLLWKQFISNPILEDPLCVGDDVFLVSIGPSLTVLSLDSGAEKWSVDRVAKILSVTSDRVYVIDRLGRMQILDRSSGRRVSIVDSIGLDFAITNPLTDRIYVGRKSGLIQCVRVVGKEQPELNIALNLKPNLPTEEPTTPEPTTPVRPVEPPVTEPADDDPFGIKR